MTALRMTALDHDTENAERIAELRFAGVSDLSINNLLTAERNMAKATATGYQVNNAEWQLVKVTAQVEREAAQAAAEAALETAAA